MSVRTVQQFDSERLSFGRLSTVRVSRGVGLSSVPGSHNLRPALDEPAAGTLKNRHAVDNQLRLGVAGCSSRIA